MVPVFQDFVDLPGAYCAVMELSLRPDGLPVRVLVYLYIGITSLCLYSNINFLQLQYGILYKIISLNLCKTQKFLLLGEKPLTPPESLCYTKYVGRPLGRFIALDS